MNKETIEKNGSVPTANVVEFTKGGSKRVAHKIETGQEIDLIDQVMLTREMSRKWRRHCTATEWMLLTYIADRTIGWGKTTFRACYKNILDGDDEYAGVGLKKTVFKEVMNSLSEKKMITRKRSRDFIVLGLNFDWTDVLTSPALHLNTSDQKAEFRPSRKPVSDKQRAEIRPQNSKSKNSKSTTSSPPGSENSCEKSFPGKSEEKFSLGDFCNGLHSADHLTGFRIGEQLDLDTKTRSEAKLAWKKPKYKINTTDLENVWRVALRKTFPNKPHIAWTTEQKKRIKPFINRFNQSGAGDVLEFAKWSVENWRQVLRCNSWMKNPPEFPTIMWWMSAGIQERFYQVRIDKAERAFENRQHQTEWEKLKLGGYSDEDATRIIAERDAKRKLQDDIKKSKRDTNRKLREAKAREDRAMRMERLEEKLAQNSDYLFNDLLRRNANGHVVFPHPKSPRMQQIKREAREKEAKAKLNAAPKSSVPAAAVPTESWDELQARLRRERKIDTIGLSNRKHNE